MLSSVSKPTSAKPRNRSTTASVPSARCELVTADRLFTAGSSALLTAEATRNVTEFAATVACVDHRTGTLEPGREHETGWMGADPAS
jgi:hypothetical protein